MEARPLRVFGWAPQDYGRPACPCSVLRSTRYKDFCAKLPTEVPVDPHRSSATIVVSGAPALSHHFVLGEAHDFVRRQVVAAVSAADAAHPVALAVNVVSLAARSEGGEEPQLSFRPLVVPLARSCGLEANDAEALAVTDVKSYDAVIKALVNSKTFATSKQSLTVQIRVATRHAEHVFFAVAWEHMEAFTNATVASLPRFVHLHELLRRDADAVTVFFALLPKDRCPELTAFIGALSEVSAHAAHEQLLEERAALARQLRHTEAALHHKTVAFETARCDVEHGRLSAELDVAREHLARLTNKLAVLNDTVRQDTAQAAAAATEAAAAAEKKREAAAQIAALRARQREANTRIEAATAAVAKAEDGVRARTAALEEESRRAHDDLHTAASAHAVEVEGLLSTRASTVAAAHTRAAERRHTVEDTHHDEERTEADAIAALQRSVDDTVRAAGEATVAAERGASLAAAAVEWQKSAEQKATEAQSALEALRTADDSADALSTTKVALTVAIEDAQVTLSELQERLRAERATQRDTATRLQEATAAASDAREKLQRGEDEERLLLPRDGGLADTASDEASLRAKIAAVEALAVAALRQKSEQDRARLEASLSHRSVLALVAAAHRRLCEVEAAARTAAARIPHAARIAQEMSSKRDALEANNTKLLEQSQAALEPTHVAAEARALEDRTVAAEVAALEAITQTSSRIAAELREALDLTLPLGGGDIANSLPAFAAGSLVSHLRSSVNEIVAENAALVAEAEIQEASFAERERQLAEKSALAAEVRSRATEAEERQRHVSRRVLDTAAALDKQQRMQQAAREAGDRALVTAKDEASAVSQARAAAVETLRDDVAACFGRVQALHTRLQRLENSAIPSSNGR